MVAISVRVSTWCRGEGRDCQRGGGSRGKQGGAHGASDLTGGQKQTAHSWLMLYSPQLDLDHVSISLPQEINVTVCHHFRKTR